MQVFQTAGVPPSNGNKILPNIGCRININVALKNKVLANRKTGETVFLAGACCMLFIVIFGYGLNGLSPMIKHLEGVVPGNWLFIAL
jgi:hypothetical protein